MRSQQGERQLKSKVIMCQKSSDSSVRPIFDVLYFFTIAGALALVFSAFIAPIANWVVFPAGEPFYEFLANICHQDFARVFYAFTHPMALCPRCVGGYVGLTIGLIVSWRKLLIGMNDCSLNPQFGIGTVLAIIAVGEAYVSLNDFGFFRLFSGAVGGFGFGLMTNAVASKIIRMTMRRGLCI